MCAELRCELNTELFGTKYQVIVRPINLLITILACFVNYVKLICYILIYDGCLFYFFYQLMLCFCCIIFTLHPPLHYHLSQIAEIQKYMLVYKFKIALIALKRSILLIFQLDTVRMDYSVII